jgi:glycosyltransferase involved in cell wall biosynthesis
MRILHVISGLGVGGAERVLVQLVGLLKDRGMPQRVVSLTDHNAWRDELGKSGVPVDTLAIGSVTSALLAVVRLSKIIEREQPDIVQGWMPHGNLVAALAQRLARHRRTRRLIWGLRASNIQSAKHLRMVWLTSRISSWPDAIVAASEESADFHVHHGFRSERITIVHNCVDTIRFRPNDAARKSIRRQLNIRDTDVVAIHVARVDPMKNHAMFIEAARRLPEVRALLVGSGTESLPLPGNATALGIRRDMEALFAASDIVVSTSSYAEGFGNVVAEGMSAGCVPIATDVGGFRSLIGDTGHVVQPRDTEAFVKALAAVSEEIKQTGALRRRAQVRTRILDSFAINTMVDRYESVYRRVTAHRAARQRSF